MSITIVSTRLLAAVLIVATGLSIVESTQWWIRIWDFPRLQILVALVLAGLLSLWTDRTAGRWLAAGCALAAGWQMYRIYPYTPLAQPELVFATTPVADSAQCFRVLSLNVLQSNRDYPATQRLIDRVRPDILLLMETDARWASALDVQLQRYARVIARPLDNSYGMILAANLPVRRHRIDDGPDATPVIIAELVAGQRFRLIGLHPRPPRPGQDTHARDAEIALAARRAASTPLPTIAIGDFNDVAWSHTSQLFKRVGRYLDPRVGRGTYATFPAQVPLLGWPLDHLFVTRDVSVRSLDVLEDVGSDHLPVTAELCVAGPVPGSSLPDPATPEDHRDVEEIFSKAGGAKAGRG